MQQILASDAEVIESSFVKDIQTGANVEIDVLIKAEIGGATIIIGIECRDRKRPATVEWVREVKGKHEHLPINKSVIVSSSGFTNEAKKKAAALGIDALTIEEAESTEWIKYLKSLEHLKFAGFTLSLIETKVVFEDQTNIDPSKFGDSSILIDSASGYRGTVNEFSALLIQSEGAAKVITEAWFAQDNWPKDLQRTINYNPNTPIHIVDADNREHSVKSIHCKVNISVIETSLSMTSRKFRDSNFATGEVEDVFSGDTLRKFIIVSKEENGKLGAGLIMTPEGEIHRIIKSDIQTKMVNDD